MLYVSEGWGGLQAVEGAVNAQRFYGIRNVDVSMFQNVEEINGAFLFEAKDGVAILHGSRFAFDDALIGVGWIYPVLFYIIERMTGFDPLSLKS